MILLALCPAHRRCHLTAQNVSCIVEESSSKGPDTSSPSCGSNWVSIQWLGNKYDDIYRVFIKNVKTGRWKDGLAIKSTYCLKSQSNKNKQTNKEHVLLFWRTNQHTDPRTHIRWFITVYNFSCQGLNVLSWLLEQLYVCGIHLHRHRQLNRNDKSNHSYYFISHRAKVTQQLRAHAALAEDLSSVPSILVCLVHQMPNAYNSRSRALEHLASVGTCTYTVHINSLGQTPIQKNKNFF